MGVARSSQKAVNKLCNKTTISMIASAVGAQSREEDKSKLGFSYQTTK
jgi:hypothetical protein